MEVPGQQNVTVSSPFLHDFCKNKKRQKECHEFSLYNTTTVYLNGTCIVSVYISNIISVLTTACNFLQRMLDFFIILVLPFLQWSLSQSRPHFNA